MDTTKGTTIKPQLSTNDLNIAGPKWCEHRITQDKSQALQICN